VSRGRRIGSSRACPANQRRVSGWSRGRTEQPDPAAPRRSGPEQALLPGLLGLAIYREFGSLADPSVVFFLGGGLLEVSGPTTSPPGLSVLPGRDTHAEHERLTAAGVRVLREPTVKPWGLTEMWIEDPDGVGIVLVEVPGDHPLRRDSRLSPPTV